jgi:hypothetical protein
MDTIPDLTTEIRAKNTAIKNCDTVFEELKDKLNRQEARVATDLSQAKDLIAILEAE